MTTSIDSRRVEILLVEDNPADAELAVIGLESGNIPSDVHVVEDGESAMEFLRREGEYGEAARHDIILLDLILPGMDGREVLHQIKHDDELRTIPVIVLTTSSAPPDIQRAYRDYANSFMTKPVDFDKFQTLLSGLTDYWFNLVHLPGTADS